jgi:hypothetical protein
MIQNEAKARRRFSLFIRQLKLTAIDAILLFIRIYTGICKNKLLFWIRNFAIEGVKV